KDVEIAVQVTGVEARREHAVERNLELFEDPARPAGVHRAAIAVPQADAGYAQPARVAGSVGAGAGEVDAEIPRDALERRAIHAAGAHVVRAGLERRRLWAFHAERVCVWFVQGPDLGASGQ